MEATSLKKRPIAAQALRPNADFAADYDTEEPTQRIGPLVSLPELLREFGSDHRELLASLGLGAGVLDAPDNRIAFADLGRLLHECVQRSGCEHFPLLFGRLSLISNLGLPGQLIRHTPKLGAALKTFATYQHLNSQGMVKFLMESDGIAAFGSVIYDRGAVHIDKIYDGDAAATLAIIRELMGEHWTPEQVLFAHAKPGDVGPYRRFFRAPCKFNCERTAIVFAAPLLEQPIPGADPAKLRTLEAQARARDDFGLVFRLRRSLRTLLVANAASGDEMAKLLSMHRRTLNRKLKAEGTTFQELLDEARYETACQLLDNSHIAITDIAASLGYSETSAFSRAFRRWSGATPVARRDQFQHPRPSNSAGA